MASKNIRVYNTNGREYYNLYDVNINDDGSLDWECVEAKLDGECDLEHLTTDFDEIEGKEDSSVATIRIWMASDTTHGQHYEVDTDLTDIIDIAYKFGRAEQGEIVSYNGETAGWDSQYRKYRRQLDNGRWQ
jgi:hypothetical protein